MSIHKHFPTTLTSDQQDAIQRIDTFLQNKTPVFLLKGYAGTGKTFLLEGLVRYLENAHRPFRLMAPTGRAATVITNKTKVAASTIHRAIYNMKDLVEDESTFKMIYKLHNNGDSLSTVYIVDEASMISNIHQEDEFFQFGSGHLLDDLIHYIRFSERAGAKLIFIGDHAQLPPVGMNTSPALKAEYLKNKYQLETEAFELKEVLRQKGNSGILANATPLREALAEGEFSRFEIKGGFQDVTILSDQNFSEAYLKRMNYQVSDHTMVVTHSNKKALMYNKLARSHFFPGKETVQPGDMLMITKNNYNYETEIFNGQFARVLEVGPREEPKKIVRFYLKGGKVVERHLTFRDVLLEINPDFPLRCKILDDFLMAEEGRLHPYDQRALYVDFKERMRKKGLKPGSDLYKDALRKDQYFNALQTKYGYAVTCHKSQGGEWPYVFVDFDVMIGVQSPVFYRWAYTAITRANSHLYSIGARNYSPLSEFVIHSIQKIRDEFPKHGYYVPPVEENNPEVRPLTFLQWRYQRILEVMNIQGIEVKHKDADWIEKYTFSRGEKQSEIWLYYNKQFFTGKDKIQSSNDNEFTKLIKNLLNETLAGGKIAFHPDKPFQQELYDYLTEILQEEEILITNIRLEDWKDIYFLKTEAKAAILEFYYGSKGIYTSLIPKSSDGSKDEKLRNVIDRLAGRSI